MLRRAIHRVVPGHRRFRARTWALSQPLLSDAYMWANPLLRDRRVTPATGLLIDGYPRSANGFATYALRHVLGGDTEIASLAHAPRNFYRAVRWDIPAVLLIREPDAVVASLITYDPTQDELTGYRSWARFHEALVPLAGHLEIAEFSDVTGDLPRFLERLEDRFELGIDLERAASLRPDDVMRQLDQRGRELVEAGLMVPERLTSRSSRPVPGRTHRSLETTGAAAARWEMRAWEVHRLLTGGPSRTHR